MVILVGCGKLGGDHFQSLGKYGVVIQEKFQLLRWRRNVSRCFGRWFAGRLSNVTKVSVKVEELNNLAREELPGVWIWKR